MAHYRRRQRRTKVRCRICTPHRLPNAKTKNWKAKDQAAHEEARKEVNETLATREEEL